MSQNVAVIICAAGASTRFGGKKKKPFVDVKGKAAFLHSVELFSDHAAVKQILLAVPPDDLELINIKWAANLNFFGTKICLGGKERFETVNNALKLVKDDIDLVAVHDAVRCCLKKEWVDNVFAAAEKSGAAILACPVIPTIKKVKGNTIIETIDRSNLYQAQTPQVFEKDLLKKAYENLVNMDKNKISDDAQLIEALGNKVTIVKTDSSNIKITHSSDVAMAEAILKAREKAKLPKGPTGPYVEVQW